jgi:cytosine/adenosine deaminase-related metal-dependent hydrolase
VAGDANPDDRARGKAVSVLLCDAEIDGARRSLRIVAGRIESVDAQPAPGETVVDLHGDRLLPGLINAHDHLQLNNYPRLRFRERYANASEWIHDIDSRRHSDPALLAGAAVPRAARLLQGGLKNLLSGVTTVAHHDPGYEPLHAADFPVNVVREYGWSHSLHIDGAAAVAAACAATNANFPWIIHAGEGIDAAATQEFETLGALGCLRANTVIVHGIGFSRGQLERLARAGGALVWCPGSNDYLFGRGAPVEALAAQGCLALGSDSRLSGERDLLAELRVARELGPFDEKHLRALVTHDAARVLRLADRGSLCAGARADLTVLPRGLPLCEARRADVRAVFVGGELRYGDAEVAAAAGMADGLCAVTVDGAGKLLSRTLVAGLAGHGVLEPGVTFFAAAGTRAA